MARTPALGSVDIPTRQALLSIGERFGTPPGSVISTVAVAAPSGYLMLNGATITNGQSLYPKLWAVIPVAWKSGANLILPDARGRAIIGAGAGAGLTSRTLGQLLGAETVALTAAESGMPAHNTNTENQYHTHTATNWLTGTENQAHTHNTDGNVVSNYDVAGRQSVSGAGWWHGITAVGTTAELQNHNHWVSGTTDGTHSLHNHAVAAANAASAHNNMPPSIALNWIIKT